MASPRVLANNDLAPVPTLYHSNAGGDLTTIGAVNQLPGAAANFSADPMLQNDQIHLNAGSMCIDSGTSDGAPAEDYDAMMRPMGGGFDVEQRALTAPSTRPTSEQAPNERMSPFRRRSGRRTTQPLESSRSRRDAEREGDLPHGMRDRQLNPCAVRQRLVGPHERAAHRQLRWSRPSIGGGRNDSRSPTRPTRRSRLNNAAPSLVRHGATDRVVQLPQKFELGGAHAPGPVVAT